MNKKRSIRKKSHRHLLLATLAGLIMLLFMQSTYLPGYAQTKEGLHLSSTNNKEQFFTASNHNTLDPAERPESVSHNVCYEFQSYKIIRNKIICQAIDLHSPLLLQSWFTKISYSFNVPPAWGSSIPIAYRKLLI